MSFSTPYLSKSRRDEEKLRQLNQPIIFQVNVFRNGRVIAYTSKGEEIKELSGRWEEKEEEILNRILSGIPQAVITFNVEWAQQ